MAGKGSKITGVFKNKIFIMAAIAVILAAAAGAVYLLTAGKSARQLYIEAERKNFNKYSQQIKKGYKDFYNAFLPYAQERNSTRSELRLTVRSDTGEPMGIKNSLKAFDLISRCKLILDTKSDTAADIGMTAASILLQKSPVLDATFISEGNRTSFTVPVFTPDRYFSVDMDKADQVYEKFGLPLRIKKLPNAGDVLSKVTFSDEAWDRTSKKCGSLLSSYLKGSNVRFDGTVTSKESGMKGRKVSVSLDGTSAQQLMGALSREAGADKELQSLTYGNFSGLMQLLSDMGLFQTYDELNRSGLIMLNGFVNDTVRELDAGRDKSKISALISDLGSSRYPDGFKMELVIDGSGNILERNAALRFVRADGTEGSISLDTAAGDNRFDPFKKGYISLKLTDTKDKVKTEQALRLTAASGGGRGHYTVDFSSLKNGSRRFELNADFNSAASLNELTGTQNNSIAYSLGITGEEPGVRDSFSGEIKTGSRKNDKTRTVNTSLSISLKADIPSINMVKTDFGIDAVTEKKLGIEPFSLPDIKNYRVTDLNKATPEELKQAENEITASMGAFYMSNKSLFDALGK